MPVVLFKYICVVMYIAFNLAKNIFCRTFLCRTPILEVTDVDFIKEVTVKQFNSFRNRRLVWRGDESIMASNLVRLRDDQWKHTRSILTPTFTSGKLKQVT